MHLPDPDVTFPIPGYERLCFLKNIITHPSIVVGDYTYYDDFEDVYNFERNVKYLFDFVGDRLIIGKYGMIASDVTFIMNGANHLTDAISAYPFAIFGGQWSDAMEGKAYPYRGDTVIGNDVWIGYNATILPGVKVGHGAIIGAHAVVAKDVAPYTIVAGNPALAIRQRFSEEQVEALLEIAWWEWSPEKVAQHIRNLTSGDIDYLRNI